MKARIRARAHPALLVTVLLALGPALGCVTHHPQADPDLDLKRARSHYDIAVDHIDNGRIELALRELVAAERLDPGNPRIQHGLGVAYLAKGKLRDAESHLLQAVAIRPDYHDARFNLSTLYLNEARYADCIEQAKILYDDPTYVSPWRALANWGWADYKLGRVPQARERLEQAHGFNARYWPALLNLGILEAEQGRKPEAIVRFNETLELAPGPDAEAEVNYRLGEIYVAMGNRERAVGHLRTAVVKAPSGRWGKKSEEYLKLLR
jgi:type IV pilus assembly protein PilF